MAAVRQTEYKGGLPLRAGRGYQPSSGEQWAVSRQLHRVATVHCTTVQLYNWYCTPPPTLGSSVTLGGSDSAAAASSELHREVGHCGEI